MLIGALAAVSAAESLAGQQKVALGKPLAETAESFTQVTSIRELPSGKVLVSDQRDKIVQLVDLSAGTMTKVGREGSGPGEYAFAGSLLAMPDGTTLLHDLLNNRFLIIGADGKPSAFLEMPRTPEGSTGSGSGRMPLGRMMNIRGSDNRGRLYFAGSPFSATGGTADSVPLLRWDRVKPTFDTVGYLRLPANSVSRTEPARGQMMVRMGNNIQFTPAETWGVAGDGSVARIFPSPYRVAWYSDQRKVISGPVVPYTPFKVTEADKKEVIDAQRRNPGVTMVIGGPGGGGARPGAAPPSVQLPEPEFAETKPPYNAGLGLAGAAVVVAPEGDVWVLRTRPAGDKIPTYDVFDRTGTLVKKVSLNPSSRVVGFGKGVVYVARSDEDDLVYLQRFTRP